MANNKSARKRIKINERNRLQNRFYKSSVKTLVKKFYNAVESYKSSETINNKESLQQMLNAIYSLIDKGTKKNVFPKNTAARKKSQLAASLKAVSIN